MPLANGNSNPNLTFLIFGVGNVSIASKHQISAYLDMLPYKEIMGAGDPLVVNELFYRDTLNMPKLKTRN